MATSPPAGRVLVADDDADLLALAAFALRNAGFDVLTVPNGTRALAELSCSPFMLAVLDVTMPGLNGFAVCEQLRTRSALPVIMLSPGTRRPTSCTRSRSAPTTAPKFNAHVLTRAEFDALQAKPENLLIIDVRGGRRLRQEPLQPGHHATRLPPRKRLRS